MLRAVVDTNITVSGLLFGGVPFKIIEAALSRQFLWITSPVLIDETERVMRSEKFGLTKQEIHILTAPILGIAEIVVPVKTIDVIKRCPADNRVLECAAEGKCSAATGATCSRLSATTALRSSPHASSLIESNNPKRSYVTVLYESQRQGF